MSVAVGSWVRQQARVYFDNATLKRDFRVQLRGARAALLWGFYLVILGGLAEITFATIAGQSETLSLSEAQQRLHQFYQTVFIYMSVMVALIAPALGASAVVTERQRRALDLVFSAPVSPKYYLVGKLLSIYRYIWMLLVLSLPIVSVGAVMGGATWMDVFRLYVVISVDALLAAAISLSISAGSAKLPPALAYSYAVNLVLTVIVSIEAVAVSFTGSFGRGDKEAPVIVMASPFIAQGAEDSVTMLLGHLVPNWILWIPIALILTWYVVLGGGSALATRHVRETAWFRACSLGVIGVVTYMITGGTSFSGTSVEQVTDSIAALALLGLFAVPFVTCYSQGDPMKFSYDGPVKLGNSFRALPSGSLGYVLAMVAAVTVGGLARLVVAGHAAAAGTMLAYGVWMLGLYLFTWGVCRFTPRVTGSLTASRALATVGVVMILLAPVLIADMEDNLEGSRAWISVTPFGVFSNAAAQPQVALVWGAVFGVAGIFIGFGAGRFREFLWRV